jgi:hypothetical protein
MNDDIERRRHNRVRLDGRMVGRATVLTDFRVVSLSETGATLEMALPLLPGSLCDLTLNLSHLSVDVKGRVVNVQPPPEPAGGHVVGVDFVDVDETDNGLLVAFLDRERRRAV